jgi:hypothetical protein
MKRHKEIFYYNIKLVWRYFSHTNAHGYVIPHLIFILLLIYIAFFHTFEYIIITSEGEMVLLDRKKYQMFNTAKNKKAWMIRKQTAKAIGCKVSLVSWKICLEMADVYYVTIKSEIIEDAKCEITLTRANGVTETVCNPKVTRCNDTVFANMKAANMKVGSTLISYKNIEAIEIVIEVAKPMSNGDMIDEIDAIIAKAHETSIMTFQMSKRINTLTKAVK